MERPLCRPAYWPRVLVLAEATYDGDAIYSPQRLSDRDAYGRLSAYGFTYLGSLAQLVSGHSWKTTITLVNHGAVASRAKLDFFDNNGEPLSLPISVPVAPQAEPVSLTTVERTLEAGASFSFYTDGPVGVETPVGWAQMYSDGDITGFAVFRQNVDREQEAVVPLETANPDCRLLWFKTPTSSAPAWRWPTQPAWQPTWW